MGKEINNVIGNQLKLARRSKGWSLDVASKHTGVSKAMLGQIERSESSPTIVKLWDIANGFQLPLSYFLKEIQDKFSIQPKFNTERSIEVSTIFPFDQTTQLEVFSLSLPPKHQHISAPHNEGVIEHILVIEGDMEYFLDGEWTPLNEGESVKFNANVEHGYRNLSDSQTTFHNIISYSHSKVNN